MYKKPATDRLAPAHLLGAGGWLLLIVLLAGCHLLRRHPIDQQSSLAREMTFNGIDAMQRGRINEAQNLFTQAVEAAPDDQRIRAELARTLAETGQLPQAIAQMQQAVRLSGGEASYHVELGELYLCTGQMDLASQHAEQALRINRRMPSAWALQGRVHKAMGQLEPARISFHRALSNDSEMNDVRFELAQVYDQLQQPQRALSVLEGLQRRYAPDDFPAEFMFLQGKSLAAIGQLDKAAETLTAAADKPDAMPELLLELSRIQVLRGDIGNARRILTRGRELFGNHPEFNARLAELAANPDANSSAKATQ